MLDVRLAVETATCPRTTCPSLPIGDDVTWDRVRVLSADAAARLRSGLDLDALHLSALLGLLWADSAGNSIRRAVSSLRTVTRLSARSARALTDLSAALLVQAERTGSAEDLAEAVDAAVRSRALDSTSAATRFDLALGLDRLGLEAQAAWAWQDYLRVDSTSDWANAARRGWRTANEWLTVDSTSRISDASTVDAIEQFARQDPQAARELAWDELLGLWGDDVTRGDSSGARRLLFEAQHLGVALEQRGGDASLADAARRLRRPRQARLVAPLFRLYGDGRRAFQRGDLAAARGRLTAVVRDRVAAAPLTCWATVYLAAIDLQTSHMSRALALADSLRAHVDVRRYPALAAQIEWTRAIALFRSGEQSEGALRTIDSADHLFAVAGETDNVGATEFLAGDMAQVLGDRAKAQAAFHHAALTLRKHRHSAFLHNALLNWGRLIANDLPAAAARLHDEDVDVATHSGSSAVLLDARTARARSRLDIRDTAGARADIGLAVTLVDSIPPGPLRDWLRANLQLVRGATLGRDQRAASVFDSAVAFFDENDNPVLESQALAARADAHLLAGDTANGATDLRRMLELMHRRQAAITSRPIRLTLLDAARRTIDRLTMLRIGTPREALMILERGRASLLGTTNRAEATRPHVPADEAVIDYALVGDTLLTWVIQDSSVTLRRSWFSRDSLARDVAEITSSLEGRRDQRQVDRELSSLYDRLFAPIRGDVAPSDTSLVVILDGELSGVPFAALRDRVQHRYLIESFRIRFANSLADLGDMVVPGTRDTAGTVLLVADPAFDPQQHPDLSRLGGARREVAAVAQWYPGARVIEGTAADPSTIRSVLSSARVIHLAVHALVDDDDPDHSALVLSRSPVSGASDELHATTIGGLTLTHSPLVVLSACETGVDHAGRSGGFAGLAGAFLRAGAHGVVGSLWRVDDQFVQSFVVAFHQAYAATGDGPGALRVAQLQLLRGRNPALRAPPAWAAFRYNGAP
ncbi:MAG TPA: CHAT domain-containing protein [Gemmatimonadaceae bacterium]|nr:CHAT domain-containing protein [Gemmatimonadaceae bacterium]